MMLTENKFELKDFNERIKGNFKKHEEAISIIGENETFGFME
jgi:hypothetical protein